MSMCHCEQIHFLIAMITQGSRFACGLNQLFTQFCHDVQCVMDFSCQVILKLGLVCHTKRGQGTVSTLF